MVQHPDSVSAEVDEETVASQHYKKYQNQGSSYYGDLDEADENLLGYEVEAENEGMWFDYLQRIALRV